MSRSTPAFGAGVIRSSFGEYDVAFWMAGVLCVLAGLSFLTIGRQAVQARMPPPVTA